MQGCRYALFSRSALAKDKDRGVHRPHLSCQIEYFEHGRAFAYDSLKGGPGRFPVSFFPLGLFFQKAVDMHVVEGAVSRRMPPLLRSTCAA